MEWEAWEAGVVDVDADGSLRKLRRDLSPSLYFPIPIDGSSTLHPAGVWCFEDIVHSLWPGYHDDCHEWVYYVLNQFICPIDATPMKTLVRIGSAINLNVEMTVFCMKGIWWLNLSKTLVDSCTANQASLSARTCPREYNKPQWLYQDKNAQAPPLYR